MTIKLLSTPQIYSCLKMCERYYKKLVKRYKDVDKDQIMTLAQNGCLAYFCLYKNKKRAFISPNQAINKLSTNQLLDVYNTYQQKLTEELKCRFY